MIHIEHIEEHGGGSGVRLDIGPQVVRGNEDQDLFQGAARVTSTDRGEIYNKMPDPAHRQRFRQPSPTETV